MARGSIFSQTIRFILDTEWIRCGPLGQDEGWKYIYIFVFKYCRMCNTVIVRIWQRSTVVMAKGRLELEEYNIFFSHSLSLSLSRSCLFCWPAYTGMRSYNTHYFSFHTVFDNLMRFPFWTQCFNAVESRCIHSVCFFSSIPVYEICAFVQWLLGFVWCASTTQLRRTKYDWNCGWVCTFFSSICATKPVLISLE